MERHSRSITINKAASTTDNVSPPPWVVLVIDDVQSVLDVTRSVLKRFSFMGRGLQLECATSAQEAKQLYRRYPDAALVLLDCAMEQDTAGLDFIQFLRNEQGNNNIQIVLRTGQPGLAPEKEVLLNYSINDYLSKTELSSSKLKNRIITYLRNYENIMLLEDQNNQLLARNQTEGELLSTANTLAGSIAHEIKNPLDQASSSLDKIDRLLSHKNTTEHEGLLSTSMIEALYQYTHNGRRAIKRGQQIIDLILEEVKNETVDTDTFSYSSIQQETQCAISDYGFQNESEAEKIKFLGENDFYFWGDATRYHFVLFNLIKNALHYLPIQPDLAVTISLESQDHTVRVRDTGPGIAKEKLNQLFDSFYTTDKTGGTGLGLAYCKRTMNAFGGDITCHSVEGEYTEFILSFPIRPEKGINIEQKESNIETLAQQFKPEANTPQTIQATENSSSLLEDDTLYSLGAKLRQDMIIPFIAMDIFASLFERYFEGLIQLSIEEASPADNSYTAIMSPEAYSSLIASGRQTLDTFWSAFHDTSEAKRITLIKECINDLASIWTQIDFCNKETLLPTLPKLLSNYKALHAKQKKSSPLIISPEHLDGLNNTTDSCIVATNTARINLSNIETELIVYTTDKKQEKN